MPLTLRQMRYFTTLAEAGQYRRAAQRLGISQPSLSQQIDLLEQALGSKLVERRRSGIVLTPQGRALLGPVRQALEAVMAVETAAQGMIGGLSATLRLGSTPTIGPYLLPSVVSRLRTDLPDLKLVVRDGAPRDLLEDLGTGAFDLVLTQLPVPQTDFTVRPLFLEPLHLAMARDHPLAERTDLRDADLAGQDVLTLGPGFALHAQIAALCREMGARMRADYEGTSLDALRQMAAMGLGMAFLPALYVQSEITGRSGDIAVAPFRRGGLMRAVGLVWRRSAPQGALFDRIADVMHQVARSEFGRILRVAPE